MAQVKPTAVIHADPPRRTQQERRSSTRTAILAAAAEAIVETGPSTGLGEIARRAGVSTGALQYHFASKTDLLIAVVEVGWNELVERATTVDRGMPPADRVAALVSSTWEPYQQPACRAAFIVSSDPNVDAEVSERVGPTFDAARCRLDRLWLDTFADLDLPTEHVAAARRFARSHLNGMVVQRQLASVEPDPAEELDLLCRVTLDILTAQPRDRHHIDNGKQRRT